MNGDAKAGDLRTQLKAHAPNGVDVFLDNVGGEALEAALARLARGGRIVLCGAVSQYNATAAGGGPANYMQLLVGPSLVSPPTLRVSRKPQRKYRVARVMPAEV